MELATFTLTSLELGVLVGLLFTLLPALIAAKVKIHRQKAAIENMMEALAVTKLTLEATSIVIDGLKKREQGRAPGNLQATAKLYEFANQSKQGDTNK